MISKQQIIKQNNVDVRNFKVNVEDLEKEGFVIPENLKGLQTLNLDECVITNDSKSKYVRLRDENQKVRFLIPGVGGYACDLSVWTVFIDWFLSDDEQKNGITFEQLQEKNRKYIEEQIEMISKRVWYNHQSPLAKFFKGEVGEIPETMHIKRNSITVKPVKTTTRTLEKQGIEIPFGLEGSVKVYEFALLSPDDKFYVPVSDMSEIKKNRTCGWFNESIEDFHASSELYKLFGEDIKKGTSFKSLKQKNKLYIEHQLTQEKIEQCERCM